jgi:hypothetical protein
MHRFRALVAVLVLAFAACAAVVFTAEAASAAPSVVSGTLASGATLTGGQSVYDSNNQVGLIMQTDGNLVMRSQGQPLWATNTAGNSGAHVIMQTDGNLVLRSATNATLWNSGTPGNPGAYAAIQYDGNLVVRSASGAALYTPGLVNNTLTGGHSLQAGQFLYSGSYYLVMQTDGNLVTRRVSDDGAVWSSGTQGHPGAYVSMQTQGNLVIYYNGAAIWYTSGGGYTGAYLRLQNDGNAGVFQTNGLAQWYEGGTLSCGSTVVTRAGETGVADAMIRNACSRIGSGYFNGGGHGSTPLDPATHSFAQESTCSSASCDDCSGMVRWAYYATTGADGLDGASGTQLSSGPGITVTLADLEPGDLVFYGPSGQTHVGIYVGSNTLVNDLGHNEGLVTWDMYSTGDGSPTGFRRAL